MSQFKLIFKTCENGTTFSELVYAENAAMAKKEIRAMAQIPARFIESCKKTGVTK